MIFRDASGLLIIQITSKPFSDRTNFFPVLKSIVISAVAQASAIIQDSANTVTDKTSVFKGIPDLGLIVCPRISPSKSKKFR